MLYQVLTGTLCPVTLLTSRKIYAGLVFRVAVLLLLVSDSLRNVTLCYETPVIPEVDMQENINLRESLFN